MNAKAILLLSAAGLLTACENNPTHTASSLSSTENKPQEQALVFDKLIGLWKNEDGKNYERWTKNADGSYLSVGFQLNGKDTIYAEQVYVHQENGRWISENTVPDQNNGKAIPFTITTLTPDVAHFSNPAHDFPTDIHYQLNGENTINAFIAGPNQSGGHDTIPFHLVRVMK